MTMTKRIAVIGGGIAGLSAGIYGRLAGFEVDVFEKHVVAGGECTGWDRRGCHIDNCIHWLTGSRPGSDLHEVWRTVGAIDEGTAYAPDDKFFTARLGDERATFWHDLDRTERELVALSPADADEVRRLIKHVRYAQCCDIPAEKPMDMMGPLDSLKLGMRMRSMPKVMKAYGGLSVGELAQRFESPLLRMLVGDYMPKEYAAYALLVSYATMASGNGQVPLGGSREMAQRMARRLEELGGRLHLGRAVQRVLCEGDCAVGVALEGGEEMRADAVIFAADMSLLYGGLIDEALMPESWREAYAQRDRYPVMSAVQAAFLVDEGLVEPVITLMACDPIPIGETAVTRVSARPYDHEPSWAPEGKSLVQMTATQSDAEYEWWSSLGPEEYRAEKARVAQAFADALVALQPEVAPSLELLDCWTPLTYERYCGAYRGSYMGFMTVPGVKPVDCPGTAKGLDGLYLAGQWVTSPGGLPIAVTSGKFAIQRISRALGA